MNHNKQTPKTFCTTREAASLLSVSLRTAQLWVENGLLDAWKTEGGHRRISRQSVDQLLANPTTASLISSAHLSQNISTERLEPTQTKLNILIVEDDSNLRRLYGIKLKNWTMPVNLNTAGDGYEAMIMIGNIKPDLLILDLQMPGMDGFRMMTVIKNMSELNTMKIVVVTGLDSFEIGRRGGLPDDIPVFPKPIPFDQLHTIAEQIMIEKHTNNKKASI